LRSIQAARVAMVVERQSQPTPLTEKRIALGKALIKYRSAVKSVEEGELYYGSKGVAGFREFLIGKFGTILAGWKAMSKDGEGYLSFNEFCNACRTVGYTGNMKQLWVQLDTKLVGKVSLMDIDPEVCKFVGKFKLALLKRYGDMLHAWMEGIDTDGMGEVKEQKIVECVQRLGLQGELDGKKLFRFLSPKLLPTLTLKYFDADAYNRWKAGDYVAGGAKADPTFLKGLATQLGEDVESPELAESDEPAGDGSKKWRAHLVAKGKSDEARARQQEEPEFRLGLSTVELLKKALAHRHGSLLKAWREALDPDGLGRLTFGDFTQAMARLNFHGKWLVVWQELMPQKDKQAPKDASAENESNGATQPEEGDTGERSTEEAKPKAEVVEESAKAESPKKMSKDGLLHFGDLDPTTDTMLREFQTKLAAKYGNAMLAWVKGLDPHAAGKVSYKDFTDVCVDIGFSGDPEVLIKVMKPEATSKYLTLEDFDPYVCSAIRRGDLRMLSESEPDPLRSKKPHELDFIDRQQCGFQMQLRKALAIAQKEEFAKSCSMGSKGSGFPAEHYTEDFEQLCKRNHGSIVTAWRQCLDIEHSGKLAFNEFCKGLRRLGYPGDFSLLWRKYDGHLRGHIALRHIDPEADELVVTFLQLLADKFGNLDDAWRYGFGKEDCEPVDEAALTSACTNIGYPHSAKTLFKCLQPAPGRQHITIWELDRVAARRRARGEVPVIHVPKTVSSPKSPSSQSQAAENEGSGAAKPKPSDQRREAETKAGLELLPVLRQQLRLKYGSTVAAWRTCIDPSFKGSISFGSFILVCEDCCFGGNMKGLWKGIATFKDGDKGTATFKDIDPDNYRILEGFRQELVAQCGSLEKAWDAIDKDRIGQVNQEEFEKNCRENIGVTMTTKSFKKLFQVLLARISQKTLIKEDLRALLIGIVDVDERDVTWAGNAVENAQEMGATDSTQVSPDSPAGAPSPKSLASPTSKGTPSPRAHAKMLCEASHEKDKIVSTVDGLKKLLVSKYGSIFSAWRTVLDGDHNGRMSQVDLANACRFLGVKAIVTLWAQLTPNEAGHVTLKEFDPETDAVFKEFEQLVRKDGKLPKANWREFFDSGRTFRCDEGMFERGCEKLGGLTTCSPKRAFRLFRPEPGRHHLEYADIFPDHDRNDNFPEGRPKQVGVPRMSSPQAHETPDGGQDLAFF